MSLQLVQTRRKADCVIAAIASATGYGYDPVLLASMRPPSHYDEEGISGMEIHGILMRLAIPYCYFGTKEIVAVSEGQDPEIMRRIAEAPTLLPMPSLMYLLTRLPNPCLVTCQTAMGTNYHLCAYKDGIVYDPVGSQVSLSNTMVLEAYALIGTEFPTGNVVISGWKNYINSFDWESLATGRAYS